MLRRVFGAILSVFVLLSGICLIAGCLTIWFSKEGEYTRPLVIETIRTVAAPICVCIALTIVGFVLEWVFPAEKKLKTEKNSAALLARLTETRDLSKGDSEAIIKERKKRKNRAVVSLVLLCVTASVFLCYALVPSNFEADINSSVIAAVRILIPCLAIPFGYAVYAAYSNEKSLLREIELIKKLPASDKKEKSDPADDNGNAVLAVRMLVLLVAASILIYGFVSGGTADVLTKAVNICTECIGLG